MRALGCGGTCVSMPCSMMSVLELALCKLKSSEEHEPDLLSVDEESDLLSVAGVMMGVLDAANKAVFVLYLENPSILKETHPAEHDTLKEAWESMGKTERESDTAAEEQGLVEK